MCAAKSGGGTLDVGREVGWLVGLHPAGRLGPRSVQSVPISAGGRNWERGYANYLLRCVCGVKDVGSGSIPS